MVCIWLRIKVKRVKVEVDSQRTHALIRGSIRSSHPVTPIMHKVCLTREGREVEFHYFFEETNKVAEALTRLGIHLNLIVLLLIIHLSVLT